MSQSRSEPLHPTGYTAAQLAVALRLNKRSVLKALVNTPASGVVMVRGNETPAWTIAALPDRLRVTLVELARQQGLDLADYITASPRSRPPVPLAEIADECLADARRLRDALLPALQRENSSGFDRTERVRLGLEDYRRVFGYTVSARHWCRLFARALQDDCGAEDFQRLELYLPKNPRRKSAPARLLPHEAEFQELSSTIAAFADPSAPTGAEKAALWAQVFALIAPVPKSGRKAMRRQLVKFLSRHLPSLAENEHALRVNFERKFSRWQANGKSPVALLDRRESKRGLPTAEPIPQADRDAITWKAVAECGGRVAQAVRELAERGQRSGLSHKTLELVSGRGKSKSYVNRRVLNTVKHDVELCAPYLLGKKAIDDATAHLERDYSKLASMQVVCADDFTMPVYFYVPDGRGWYDLTRGQVLLMMDVRSWKVIGWSLQPERNYNSLVIRTLMNQVVASWGLPAVWYFERGIWKNARVVKGDAPAGWNDGLSWPETQVGWEQSGVRFVHATRARSKPAERVGGLVQDLMEGARGYCGRDERRDCPEATKRAMDDVRAKRVNHPGELFLSFDEWETQLGQIVDRYNRNSQDGEVLAGLSPDEAFESCWPHTNPPARMDAACWHLVAHYVKQVPVTANGISFRIGARKFVYRDERTGQDRGKQVLAWFDPECPEFLCVTDLNRRNPYLVERSQKVDFLAALGDENYQHQLALVAAHSAYPKARFHVLKSRFAPTFRRNLVDVTTAEVAQEITAQRQTIEAAQKQQAKQASKARASYGRLGMPTPARVRPGQIEAADELHRMFAEDETTEESK